MIYWFGGNESGNPSSEKEVEQLIDLQNDPLYRTLFPQQRQNVDELFAFKLYSTIDAKAIKILYSFASSYLCEDGFSVLTEIKNCNCRRNAGMFVNKSASFQSYLCSYKQANPAQ